MQSVAPTEQTHIIVFIYLVVCDTVFGISLIHLIFFFII
jgi:hypothetical protein